MSEGENGRRDGTAAWHRKLHHTGHDEPSEDTPQTPGMRRYEAISGARAEVPTWTASSPSWRPLANRTADPHGDARRTRRRSQREKVPGWPAASAERAGQSLIDRDRLTAGVDWGVAAVAGQRCAAQAIRARRAPIFVVSPHGLSVDVVVAVRRTARATQKAHRALSLGRRTLRAARPAAAGRRRCAAPPPARRGRRHRGRADRARWGRARPRGRARRSPERPPASCRR
jgi:hypothetical protein